MSLVIASLLCSAVDAGVSPRPIRVKFGTSGSATEKLARAELVSYLGKIFTNKVDVSGRGSSFDIVVGTPDSNPAVKKALSARKISLPQGKNADQGYTLRTTGGATYVVGRTHQGALYGVYELLEQYGVYFQISGERLPKRGEFEVLELDISRSPVFKYRGLLPWDNFINGMSGYNYEDYQQLINRATRMKLNMLQIHFYPGFVMFTEEWNGKPSSPSFIGCPVDTFKTKGTIAEKAFGGETVFGSKPYIDNTGSPLKQAEACQAMLRKAIDYAHSHAMVTSVGFALMTPEGGNPHWTDRPNGYNYLNPLDSHNVDLSLERYRRLVKLYPNSDFYWMWQTEAGGFYGTEIGREPGAAEMREKYAKWSGRPELNGDIDYAYLFREVANRLTPQERSKLATGGWSIEHLFPNIDKDFPKEVIFASLNDYYPDSGVKRSVSYKVAQNGRRAWMIDWWEFDGNEWFPQFRINWQEQMYKNCAEYGVEAVTVLGWKLSAVEHNVRYLADFCWNPKLSTEEFYNNYISKLYGPKAQSLVKAYMQYDKYEKDTPGACPGDPRTMLLGAGWCSLAIPALPGKLEDFDQESWKDVVERANSNYCGIAGQEMLYKADQDAIKEMKFILPKLDEQGKSWARLMINRLEFRCLYLQSTIALNKTLLTYDEIARKRNLIEAKTSAHKYAKLSLDYSVKAIEKYAQDIRNRSDLGTVAQLNEQYYKILKHFAESLSTEKSPYTTADWTTFRINPSIKYDFTAESAWKYRDGKISMSSEIADGKPVLRLSIGGDKVANSSVFIHEGALDLDKSPFMDFKFRTDSREPLVIMFQAESDGNWYALNLIDVTSQYRFADSVSDLLLNDGKWHRVTCDLLRLCKERIGVSDPTIRNVILGSWASPSEPIIVEFSDFALGKRNLLD